MRSRVGGTRGGYRLPGRGAQRPHRTEPGEPSQSRSLRRGVPAVRAQARRTARTRTGRSSGSAGHTGPGTGTGRGGRGNAVPRPPRHPEHARGSAAPSGAARRSTARRVRALGCGTAGRHPPLRRRVSALRGGDHLRRLPGGGAQWERAVRDPRCLHGRVPRLRAAPPALGAGARSRPGLPRARRDPCPGRFPRPAHPGAGRRRPAGRPLARRVRELLPSL